MLDKSIKELSQYNIDLLETITAKDNIITHLKK